jgi:uncharacterized protein (TIGR03083 family)
MDAPSRPMTADALLMDLRDVWGSLDDLLDSLDDEDWAAPTDCPGWTVQDTVAHVIGTELMMAGRPSPEVEVPDAPHLRNDIGRMNEATVIERRGLRPARVLEEYREVVAEREAAVAALDQAALDAESWTPAGMATLGRFLQIRVFDTWIHEQDIRTAVGREGHLEGPSVTRTLAEVTNGIGYVVGKKAGTPDGASVRFSLTSPAPATIDVVVDGRARVADDLQGKPTATITTDVGTFMRLVAGRRDAAGALADGLVTVSGDAGLADRVLANLGYTI